jgi:hypothetical protein
MSTNDAGLESIDFINKGAQKNLIFARLRKIKGDVIPEQRIPLPIFRPS